MSEEIKNVMSLNARGLRNGSKRRGLFNWLKKYHDSETSFVLLQETHSTPDMEATWKKEYGSNIIFNHGSSKSGGTAILIPKNVDVNVLKIERFQNGRCVAIEAKLNSDNGDNVFIANVYAPTQDHTQEQVAMLNDLYNITEQYLHCSLIIGGDFNLCMDPVVDKYGSTDKHSEYRTSVKGLCESFNIVDIWRILNPDVRRYTWRQCNPLRQSRLDYILTSIHLMYNITNIEILPSYKSDHSLIKLHFQRTETGKRGPGFWKFNKTVGRSSVPRLYQWVDRTV